jgi:hypothetical protein
MKLWLAIITSGALLMAHTMNSSNGFGSKLAEAQANIAQRNAERVYAATNGAIGNVSIGIVTVRDHVAKLKTMIPLECVEGDVYLDRIHSINPSPLPEPKKNIVITQKVNRLCGLSIALPDTRESDQRS